MDIRDRITLEPDPVWADRYENEREQVRAVSDARLLDIFHVGSTAIPDLPGKPALDVLAVFTDYDGMRATAQTLADMEYELAHDDSDCILVIDWRDDHAVFIKMHTQDDDKVQNQLIFRDYLRETPEARREYERAKRKAADDHPDDEQAYTQAKAPTVRSLLEQAHAQGYAEQLPDFV